MHSEAVGCGVNQVHAEDGVSLVEVLVAMFLLATALMALAQVATTGLFAVRDAADRTTAMGLATRAVEAARHVPWEDLALDSAAHSAECGTLVAIDAAGSLTEPVLCASAGGVGGTAPFWGAEGPYDVRSHVTSIPGFPNARRVTATVTWRDHGGPREVRTSTVIAQVDRG
jgi:hypothetical protein